MKIIHTSDVHLASRLSARLPSSKASLRRRELTESFSVCAVTVWSWVLPQ